MVTFRKADSSDAKRIANLHAESWQRTYRGNFSDAYLDSDVFAERQSSWNTRLNKPAQNQWVVIAQVESELAGFLCVFGDEDSQWGSFIDNLHVDIKFQGQGIGAGLMNQASLWLAEYYNHCGVFLHVWESNPALHFYEKLGGRNTGIVEEKTPMVELASISRWFGIALSYYHSNFWLVIQFRSTYTAFRFTILTPWLLIKP